LFEFLRASNLSEKNLNNSPKFYLDMIFMNVNLGGCTCMQKFEDTVQVAFEFDVIIKEYLNLSMNFERGLDFSYTVAAL
jgi:hypothetical protein